MTSLCCDLTFVTGLMAKSGGWEQILGRREGMFCKTEDFASSLVRQELEFLALNRDEWATYVSSEDCGI